MEKRSQQLTYTAAISGGSILSQAKKELIKHIETTSGAKTDDDLHPSVEPDVKAKIKRTRAAVRDSYG